MKLIIKIALGIILAFVLLFVGCVGCMSYIATQVQKEIQQPNMIINQEQINNQPQEPEEERKLIENLNKNHESFNNLDISKIDCENPEYQNVGLMKISLTELNGKEVKTATWFPSLNEGRITYSLINLKNIGCTKIYPIYSTIIVFNNKIIFSSFNNAYLGGYDMYPTDYSIGSLSLSGSIFKPIFVKSKGNYIIYVYIVDKNTNNVVGIDKMDLNIN